MSVVLVLLVARWFSGLVECAVSFAQSIWQDWNGQENCEQSYRGYVIRGESGIEECLCKFGELGFCEGHEQGEGEMGVFVCKLMEPWFGLVEMRWNMELKS